jgi:hypothetical protein
MIFHASVAVESPQRVAEVVAELWGGDAVHFAIGGNGSWVAVAGDDRGTILEVYPHGHLLYADKDKQARESPRKDVPHATSTHVAIGTVLSADEVEAIGHREGWIVRRVRRGGGFDVIELWAENSVMFEVLTSEMQAEYVPANTKEKWNAMFGKNDQEAAGST